MEGSAGYSLTGYLSLKPCGGNITKPMLDKSGSNILILHSIKSCFTCSTLLVCI